MKNIIKYNLPVAILPLLLLLTGCSGDDTAGVPDQQDTTDAIFRYSIPGMSAAVTRSAILDDTDETNIESVDVLVYEVGADGVERLSYRQWASGITAGSYTGKFDVKLAKSRQGEKYSIDFIFNAREAVTKAFDDSDISIGDTRAYVQQNLRINQPHWEVKKGSCLPMWAGIDALEIGKGTTFTDPLIPVRSVAKLDIGLDMDGSGDLPNFTLENVYYTSNASACGLLIPHKDNLNGKDVKKPSFPSPYSQTQVNAVEKCKDRKSVTNSLYLFETDANYTGSGGARYGVIFEGEYEDHEVKDTYFYRLEFIDPSDASKRIDFLRNHRYRINILEITGPGYDSLQDAIDGEPGNVVYRLGVNETGDINHVVYSDKYFLGVSSVELSYEGKEVSGIEDLKVLTNYDNGWNMTCVDESTGSQPGWITFQNSFGVSDTKAVARFNLGKYEYNDDPRVSVSTFTAGTLSIDVRITQYGRFFISTDYTGSLMKGDGDSWEVYVWGEVPSGGLIIRACGQKEGSELDVSYERKTVAGGSYNEGDITEDLDIVGNAWVPMAIRQVKFQYSIDGGTTWVTFKEGPQGKGHFTLKSSGRIVALYDYIDADDKDTFTWSEAMGIDTSWDLAPANDFYHQTITRLPYFPWTYPTFDYTLNQSTNRNALYYVPEAGFMTGCADYVDPGYEDIYPKGGWRLPSLHELFEIHRYMDHIGDLAVRGVNYWSSTDQNVTGGTHTGSYFAIINPEDDTWFPDGQTGPSSANRRWDLLYVRCVYGDPDEEVLLEQYPEWYFNPNGSPDE